MHPQSVLDPDWHPSEVSEGEWSELPEGVRVRALKRFQYELKLSQQQYRELAALPFWMSYGPENGLPEDWFNTAGYLLPKYRPGGGLYDRFRTWRHEFRRRRWRKRLLHEKLRARYRKVSVLGPFIYGGAIYIAYHFVSRALEARFDDFDAAGLSMLCLLAAFLALGITQRILKHKYPWLEE